MSIINRREISYEDLIRLNEMLFKGQQTSLFSNINEQVCYDVRYVQKSESAWILFVQPVTSNEKLVVKVLCDYHDDRYDLSSVEQRRECQQEALHWNSTFSSGIYYGLFPIYNVNVQRKQIVLGSALSSQVVAEQNVEYALVMRELPSERRLDVLIDDFVKSADKDGLRGCTDRLVQHVVLIHKDNSNILTLNERDDVGDTWGSSQQLQKKLLHNLALADSASRFREKFQVLKNAVEDAHIYEQREYRDYFEGRVGKYIKRCHGDLKSPNIWVEGPSCVGKECVAILDSIDFNPMYYNIDILSDFATLVVDIQTRTRGFEPARVLIDEMIERYLENTQQQDGIARAILSYYLFEKAYVGAAISIVYDDAFELGAAYLDVAEMRLNEFVSLPLRIPIPV